MILFNGTELLNTTYIPRYVKHESATERQLGLLDLARDNGSVLVTDRRGVKRITLTGILTATTTALLEAAVDNFKALFALQEKNLDIVWGSGTRRYVATCAKHEFDRDYFHLLFVPWSAEFVVASGVGEDTSETTIVNADTFHLTNYKTKQFTLLGSGDQKIRFIVHADSTTTTELGIELKNTDNGDRMVVNLPNGITTTDLEIDTRLKTVKVGATPVSYYGVFPRFSPGTNNIQITAGDIIDQQQINYDSNFGIYGNAATKKVGQSFMVPYTDQTYKSVWLYLGYVGNPAAAMDIRIETDNNGEASGTLVDANASAIIDKTGISDANGVWVLVRFTDKFTLTANTKYWIVCKPHGAGTDVSNAYWWGYASGTQATYKLGNAAVCDTTWTQEPNNDMQFKLCYGGAFSTTKTFTYSVFQTTRYL